MSFKTADFKKTTRKSDDERVLYPYQIRDDRYTAAISYGIDYYERMVGRRRAEFEADTLLEFFGDPKLARGLVACLARTYAWREQTFAEALGEDVAQTLWRAGLASSAALRTRLYGLANGRYGGVILPAERAEALEFLCAQINEEAAAKASPLKAALTPALFERGLTLDAEDAHVLAKLGPMPTAQEIIARYNYHSLETALCHAESIRLRLRGPVWSMIRSAHNLARRYKLRYSVGDARTLFDDQVELTLFGARDAFGNWQRAGRRLARVLLRMLAVHPDSLTSGEALVHLGGQKLIVRLDERALRVLGVAAQSEPADSEAWDENNAVAFQRAWTRALVAGRTAGWRLRRDPEPVIGAGTVVVPDFILQRGNERLALCLAAGRTAAMALVRDLAQLGSRTPALALVPQDVAETLPSCPVPLVTYNAQPAEAVPQLVATLERRHPRSHAASTLTPWQRLEGMVADEGFVSEATVATLLSCTADEAAATVRRWGGSGFHVLPGLGVCSPDALGDIRQLIEQNAASQHAA